MKYVKSRILIFRYSLTNSGTISKPCITVRGYIYFLRKLYNIYGLNRLYEYDLIEYINTI